MSPFTSFPSARRSWFGKELRWILQGGIEICAATESEETCDPDEEGFILRIQPDVYTTVAKGHMDRLAEAGTVTRYYTYAHNRLVLMAKAGEGWPEELDAEAFYDVMADPDNVISEPDILTQGIERHIWRMYTATTKVLFPDDPDIQALDPNMFDPAQLGSDPEASLRRIVYHDKVAEGQTLLTAIHHLETPANILDGTADLGPVWGTEIAFQHRLGNDQLIGIEIAGEGPDGEQLNQSESVNYLTSVTKGVMDPRHKQAAVDWVNFLRSDAAQEILEGAGFIPARTEEPHIYPGMERYRRIAPY